MQEEKFARKVEGALLFLEAKGQPSGRAENLLHSKANLTSPRSQGNKGLNFQVTKI